MHSCPITTFKIALAFQALKFKTTQQRKKLERKLKKKKNLDSDLEKGFSQLRILDENFPGLLLVLFYQRLHIEQKNKKHV